MEEQKKHFSNRICRGMDISEVNNKATSSNSETSTVDSVSNELPPEILKATTDDIISRTRLIENDIKVSI